MFYQVSMDSVVYPENEQQDCVHIATYTVGVLGVEKLSRLRLNLFSWRQLKGTHLLPGVNELGRLSRK